VPGLVRRGELKPLRKDDVTSALYSNQCASESALLSLRFDPPVCVVCGRLAQGVKPLGFFVFMEKSSCFYPCALLLYYKGLVYAR
jgi:hypothetical protein